MIFSSPYSAYQYIVRGEKKVYVDGVHVDTIPELLADFAIHGEEYSYVDPDGITQIAADIRGGYFDSEVAQELRGWSDEERQLVETVLLNATKKFPGELALWTEPQVATPWPTYDEMDTKQVVDTAIALGLVEPVMAYETQNKNRKDLLKKLDAHLQGLVEDAALSEVT